MTPTLQPLSQGYQIKAMNAQTRVCKALLELATQNQQPKQSH